MLFNKDATHYAEQIKKGETTVTELTERALNNIKKHNLRLNAVNHLQAKEARQTAKVMDEKFSKLNQEERNNLPPFFGIPTLLKDLYQYQAGEPVPNGSKLEKELIADSDDYFVEKFKEAGFVILGRSNVPEWGTMYQSNSKEFGPVTHPIDPKLNPGGSTGGGASALKAGLVPIVSASDGGGSIRMPASLTGLIGLKPSRARTAVGPGSYRGWQGASTHFVLTKSVRDTWAALKAMQVEQYDGAFFQPKIEEEELIAINRPLKIAYSTVSPTGLEVHPEAIASVEATVAALTELGHHCIQADPPIDGIEAIETYYILNAVEARAGLEAHEERLGRPLTADDMEAFSWALYQVGDDIKAKRYSKMIWQWDQFHAQMHHFFKEYDVLIQPGMNGPALPQGTFDHDEDMQKRLINIEELETLEEKFALIYEAAYYNRYHGSWSQQQNMTGEPAISLPIYQTAEGLPVGTQFWSKRGSEYELLQLALQLENAGYLNTDIVG